MNIKPLIPCITLGLFFAASSFAEPAENKASSESEQLIEKKTEREEKKSWIERLFGGGREKAEDSESASEETKERVGDEIIRVVENSREIIDILGIGQSRAEN